MRFGGVALSVLVAGASAFPGRHTPIRPRDDADICPLGGDDVDARKETWSKTGGPFFDKFFKDHDFEDWSKKFFSENMNDGGLATRNCRSIFSDNCGAVLGCDTYKDPKAFFVHQSMSNLHDLLHYLIENMQSQVVIDLGSTADAVTDLYGPPDPKSTDFLTYMIGGAITGAAAAGPAWFAASPLVGIAGFLNIANGVMAGDKSLTPEELSDSLKDNVATVFESWNNTLGDSCDSAFGGTATTIQDAGDPVKWIRDAFADGKFLDSDFADDQGKNMWASIKESINQGLVIMALKGGDYHVSRRTDISKEECKGMKESNYIWVMDRCSAIGKDDKGQVPCTGGSCEGWKLNYFSKDQYKKFTDTYGFNYEDAIKNAVECSSTGGGGPPMPKDLPAIGKKPPMPKCFVNLKVKQQNASGLSKGATDPGIKNEFGYTYGSSGVHFEEKKPGNDEYAYELKATIKGGQGETITTVDFHKAAPTVVIKGRESDKEAKLPYDFIMAVDDTKGDPVKFWYSNQYWTTDDKGAGKGKKFPGCELADKFEDNGVRSGDCGFNIDPPSDKPPASATEDHPLPTALPYAKGWCTFHVKQTKKSQFWMLDAKVYDNNGDKIGSLAGKIVKGDNPVYVSGPLPHKLKMTPKKDTVSFDYDGEKWNANSDHGKRSRGDDSGHECGYGDWDGPIAGDPNVSMDCGFSC